jgi:hypothetical protein
VDQLATAVSPPQTESVPTTVFYAHPRRRAVQNRPTAFALVDKTTHFGNKNAKQSNISKLVASPMMPTLKDKTTAPFVQRIDPCIWNAWSTSKQEKFVRLVRDFKFKAVQMLQDEDEVDPANVEQVDFAAAYAVDPGAFGFGSNAF